MSKHLILMTWTSWEQHHFPYWQHERRQFSWLQSRNSWITLSPRAPTLLHQFSSLNAKPVSTILQLHRFQQFQDCKYVGLDPQECYAATKTCICKAVQLLCGVSQYGITASNKGGNNKPSQGFLLPLSKSKKLMDWAREYKNSCQ